MNAGDFAGSALSSAVRSLSLAVFGLVLGGNALAQTAPSAWTAIDQRVDKGDLVGEFSGKNQTVGTYGERVEVFLLDDGGYDQNDWYLVSIRLESAVSNYKKGNDKCGWYTDKVWAGFELRTKDAIVYDFAPTTTVGSRSQSVSVGVKAKPGSMAEGTMSYSVSQSKPDAAIKVERDTVNETIVWTSSLTGCEKSTSGSKTNPWPDGASKVARSTYILNPLVIVQVPEGAGLSFGTSVDKQQTGFRHSKQKNTGVGKYRTYSTDTLASQGFRCGLKSCSTMSDWTKDIKLPTSDGDVEPVDK